MQLSSPIWPATLGPRQSRNQAAAPRCNPQPLLSLEGVAVDITSPALLAKDRDCRYLRLGSADLHLTVEDKRGWHIAMRLIEGQRYRAQVHACSDRIAGIDELPLDRLVDGTLVFWGIAHAMRDRKDEADQRRVMRGWVGVWTDGLMVACSNTDLHKQLSPGSAYKVIVQSAASPC